MEFIVWKSWPLTIGVPAGIVSDSPRTADAVILGMWGLALIVFILLVLEANFLYISPPIYHMIKDIPNKTI